MGLNPTRCYRCVGEIKNMIKYGKTKSGNQRYICKLCCHHFIENYTNQAYKPDTNQNIIQLTKEGLGVGSTTRILKISTTALSKRIVSIARNIRKPIISKGKTYEVDEMRTFINRKDKLVWIAYALEKKPRMSLVFL